MASSSGGLRMSTSSPAARELGSSTGPCDIRNRRKKRNWQDCDTNVARRGAPPMAPFNSTAYLMGLRKHRREKEAELRIMFNQYGSNAQEFPARWPFGLQVRAPHSAAGGRDSYDLAFHAGVGYYTDLYQNDADG